MSDHVHFDREAAAENFKAPEARPVLFDREALIASLEGDERMQALRDARDAAEKDAMESIARILLAARKPIDQRKIDFTAGYFAGAKHWLGGRMTVAQQRLAANAEAGDVEESDA